MTAEFVVAVVEAVDFVVAVVGRSSIAVVDNSKDWCRKSDMIHCNR